LLGRRATLDARRGRVGHEVVAAAQKMDLLVLARDRDRTDGGPPSLGPTARFVIDHSRCPLLLVFADPSKTDAT
jgi:nucleotide-binding universal stress UspA family protein